MCVGDAAVCVSGHDAVCGVGFTHTKTCDCCYVQHVAFLQAVLQCAQLYLEIKHNIKPTSLLFSEIGQIDCKSKIVT